MWNQLDEKIISSIWNYSIKNLNHTTKKDSFNLMELLNFCYTRETRDLNDLLESIIHKKEHGTILF